MEELAKEIRKFLETHANIKADYDPEWEEPEERWSSPDASEFEAAAMQMEAGEIPDAPLSSWGSGGYSPSEDKMAKRWHDDLKARILEMRG